VARPLHRGPTRETSWLRIHDSFSPKESDYRVWSRSAKPKTSERRNLNTIQNRAGSIQVGQVPFATAEGIS
jgi:hypothetical protein